jgi:serine/threonine-protein kinase
MPGEVLVTYVSVRIAARGKDGLERHGRHPEDAMIGKTISHYKILSKLGEGGMGVVYQAEDLTLQRTVALKFLPAESLASASDRSRLVHEARAAAVLLHPNICPVYEIGESDGHTFIAMGYLEGRSLKDLLADGPLPLDEALRIAKEIGEGLSAAHGKGIVHRDVKPGNVMVTPEGRAVLMDFGLAKMTGSTKLTRTGATVGTAAYMSPEQMQGKEVDGRTDVWALGVMLYEMVSGERPFQGEYEPALFYAIANAEPKPLVGEKVPAGLDGIVAKALAKRPTDRYQTVRELIEDIDVLLRDRESLPAGRARQVSGLTRTWKRWRWWERAAAVTMTCLIAGAIVYGAVTFLAPKTEVIDSIGILPLANLTGDPEKGFWADGVTEQLNAKLGAAMGTRVRVLSQQTMKQFKDSNETAPAIARRIHAGALVEGSVMLAGDRIQITTKLIDAARDRIIWSDTFEGSLSDILDLQSAIVRTIGVKIGAQLTEDAQATLVKHEAVDPRAYEAFLKGRHLVNMGTVESLKSGIERCEEALLIDPSFAAPLAVLADAYSFQEQVASLPAQELKALVKRVGQRAEEIAPGSWVTEYILAAIAYSEWNWEAAGRHFEGALRLNYNDSGTHLTYGQYLMQVNRNKEALEHVSMAYRLDPLSAFFAANVGFQLWGLGKYDEALEQADEALLLDKNNWVAHWLKGSVFLETGRYRDAVTEVEESRRLLGVPGYAVLGHLGYARAKLGDVAGAEALIAELTEGASNQHVDPVLAASIYAGLGRVDEAFASLEAGVAEHSLTVTILLSRNWPGWRELEKDPRFGDLMKRTGLDRYYSSGS